MGQKFAAPDSQGNIAAFYDSIDSPPPEGVQVIAITDDQWLSAISTQGCKIVDGALVLPPPPTKAQKLAAAKLDQIELMARAYADAIAQDVSFTTGAGIEQTYEADSHSVTNAQYMLNAYSAHGVPDGFYWVAKDNTQVPFTLADLQGLAKAMGDQGWSAFQRLQDRKASINSASTVTAVQAIVW